MGVTTSHNLEIISFTASSTQYKIGSLPISWSSCKEVSKYICENVLNLICAYFIFSTLALRIKNYVHSILNHPSIVKMFAPFFVDFRLYCAKSHQQITDTIKLLAKNSWIATQYPSLMDPFSKGSSPNQCSNILNPELNLKPWIYLSFYWIY